MSYLDENDRLANGHESVELAEHIVLGVVIRAINEHLRDALDSQLAALKLERVRVRSELDSILVDFVRESGGEEKDLDILREKSI